SRLNRPAPEGQSMSPSAAEAIFPEHHYLNAGTTARSWRLTTDHKRIGLMYMIAVLVSLLLGGIYAMLFRFEHLTPERTSIDAIPYNRLFTLHGVIMVWFFRIPSIPSILGNFFIPIMVGAKDVAFPRLNLASFYIYMFGAAFPLWGMIHGGA